MLPEREREIYDRIAHWSSPSGEDLIQLTAIRSICGQLLYALLSNCPDNEERARAIFFWEMILDCAEKSVKRK
jgi:hypothetical protein